MAGSALAASAWTGGDDLPTNPLACDATPGVAAAKPYDGGEPTGAPDRKGKKITVVDIPKLIGIGYFNATSKGIADAAKELGNVDAKTDGPTQANIDQQISFHRQLHHQRRRRHSVRGQRSGGDRAGAEEGSVQGHQCRGLRRQFAARCPPVVRQPGRVQRHRQGHGRQHGEGDRRRGLIRDRHLDLHDAQPGALDRRDGGLCGEVPSQDEVAGDGRSAGRQCAFLQPGDDAHQQIWR